MLDMKVTLLQRALASSKNALHARVSDALKLSVNVMDYARLRKVIHDFDQDTPHSGTSVHAVLNEHIVNYAGVTDNLTRFVGNKINCLGIEEMVSVGTQDSTPMSDGRSAVLLIHETQHQVSPPTDDQLIVSLSKSSVIPSSPEPAGEAVTDFHTASSLIFPTAALHTLSSWH